MKQTAVEWLVERYKNRCFLTVEDYQKAKQIENEWMLNAFQESRLTHPMIGLKHETFVDYYNKTFKSE